MTVNEIQVYLSMALDQEACRATLLTALKSRVDALRCMGIPDRSIVTCLENLIEEQYQMNDDIIEDVIEQVIILSTTDEASRSQTFEI